MQRVALARALVHRPAVVLADEPTASLDQAKSLAAASLMRQYCREVGATLIVATHDMRLAASMDEVYVIEGGELGRSLSQRADPKAPARAPAYA